MSQVITSPLSGSYTGDADHSWFGFAVRHMTVSTFHGSFGDVTAKVLAEDDGTLLISGSADVASISVRSPVDLRTHLLGEDFFDAGRHPRITFASAPARPAADGSLTVEGELTIRNVTRPVVATGTLVGPVEDPFGGVRAFIALSATIDRRDYGMTWNMPLPRGGDALGTQVEITVHLELIAD